MKLILPNSVTFVIFFLPTLQLIAAATQPPELAAAKHNSCDPILHPLVLEDTSSCMEQIGPDRKSATVTAQSIWSFFCLFV